MLWGQRGLSGFRGARLGAQRGQGPWRKLRQVLVMNRLRDPDREFAAHRRWFSCSVMDRLLTTDFAVVEKDRLAAA